MQRHLTARAGPFWAPFELVYLASSRAGCDNSIGDNFTLADRRASYLHASEQAATVGRTGQINHPRVQPLCVPVSVCARSVSGWRTRAYLLVADNLFQFCAASYFAASADSIVRPQQS